MITINRKSFSEELALLLPAVGKFNVIPALTCVLLDFNGERLRMTATDLNITLQTEISATGDPYTYALPLKQLSSLVKLFDGEDVTLTEKPNSRVDVRCGQSKHLLVATSATEFPESDPVVGSTATIAAPLLTSMLKAASISTLPDNGVVKAADQMFTGVQMSIGNGKLQLQASRKTTLAVAECPLEAPKMSAIIPPQAVNALMSFDKGEISFGATENFATFCNGDRSITARLLMGKFPDWSGVLPKFKSTLTVNSAALADAVRRAMLTTDVTNWERFEGLKFTFQSDSLRVESRGGDRGKSDESITATSTLNGDKIEFGVNGSQWLDFLKLGESVSCELPEKPAVVRLKPAGLDFDFYYVVCGVNL